MYALVCFCRYVTHNGVHATCQGSSQLCGGRIAASLCRQKRLFKNLHNFCLEGFWSEGSHLPQGQIFTFKCCVLVQEKVLWSLRTNQATQIIVNRIINHQMLWDSAHKHCHGPKQKLDDNCFWKMLLLVNKTSLHPSICPLAGTIFPSPSFHPDSKHRDKLT